MEKAFGGGAATRDLLATPREIRFPVEGVRALGLPDASDDAPPLGPGGGDVAGGKSRKGSNDDESSPLREGEDGRLGWFDVTVVDAWGAAVGGIDLEVSYQGTRKKVRTAPNGNVRIEGVDSSFGSVRFVDVAGARGVVRPRWVKKQPDASPAVDNPEVVALAPDMPSVSLTSETPRTIILVRPLPRVRLIGTHFDTNKSFMRPTAVKGVREVVAALEKSPTGHLLIVGHTDSVGGDVENLGLSVDRAEAVKAYLKNDVHAWEVWFDKPEKDKTRWADRERTQMISALPCEQSVAGFQAFSNETRGTSLAIDGKFGPATRKALIEAYMALGGTTLPDHIGIAVHACGEFFPAEDVGDQVEDEENRRVEMFCFEDEITPPVPGKRAKKGEPEYEQWKKQVTKTIDVVAGGALVTIRIRLVDRTGVPKRGTAYRLVVGDVDVEGITDDLGMLVHEVPNNVRTGELTYDDFTRTLRIGDMAEPHAPAGARPRLRNLGFGTSDASKGTLDGATREALRRFQTRHGLDVSGELDDSTTTKLEEHYGS